MDCAYNSKMATEFVVCCVLLQTHDRRPDTWEKLPASAPRGEVRKMPLKASKTSLHRHYAINAPITLHGHRDVHNPPVVAQRRICSPCPKTATVGTPPFSAHLDPDVQQRARQQPCPTGHRHVELHLRHFDDLHNRDIDLLVNALQLRNSTVPRTSPRT